VGAPHPGIALADGQVFGIEVDLHPQKTAYNNASKNTTALTIIATMPADVGRTAKLLRARLSTELQHLAVISVFELLTLARNDYGGAS
jgi:hypothetical protein